MDYSAWELIKVSIQWLVVPLIGAIAYFHKKHYSRVDELESRVSTVEVKIAVLESKIDDIREDIKEIKSGIHKLVDRKYG